jgi:hypothetical protein
MSEASTLRLEPYLNNLAWGIGLFSYLAAVIFPKKAE